MQGDGQASSGAPPAGALQAQAAPLMAQPSDSLSQQAHPSQGECNNNNNNNNNNYINNAFQLMMN